MLNNLGTNYFKAKQSNVPSTVFPKPISQDNKVSTSLTKIEPEVKETTPSADVDTEEINSKTQQIKQLTQQIRDLQLSSKPTETEFQNLMNQINNIRAEARAILDIYRTPGSLCTPKELTEAYHQCIIAAAEKEASLTVRYKLSAQLTLEEEINSKTQQIKQLTQQINDLQIPDKPTEAEFQNLMNQIRNMRAEARDIFKAACALVPEEDQASGIKRAMKEAGEAFGQCIMAAGSKEIKLTKHYKYDIRLIQEE